MMSHRRILSVLRPVLLEEHVIALHAGHTTCFTNSGQVETCFSSDGSEASASTVLCGGHTSSVSFVYGGVVSNTFGDMVRSYIFAAAAR